MEINMNMEEFLASLDPKIAKGVRMASEVETIKYPFASKGLTLATGGGFGANRITTIYGNQSSGKSMLMQQTVAQMQKQGRSCVYVDSEQTWDNKWTERLGVDNKELILVQNKSFGQVTNKIIPYIEGGVDLVVIDSISQLMPDIFLDDDGGVKDAENRKRIGAHAQACTSMLSAIHYANEKTAVVLISQTTTDLSGMHPMQIPHGGKKVLYNSSQIIKLFTSASKAQQIKDSIKVGDKLIEGASGVNVTATIEKNKTAPPGQQCSYDIYYNGDNVGIDVFGEVADLAELYGVIRKAGAWLYFEEESWQGRPKFIKALKSDPDLFAELNSRLDVLMGE